MYGRANGPPIASIHRRFATGVNGSREIVGQQPIVVIGDAHVRKLEIKLPTVIDSHFRARFAHDQ